MPPVANGRSPLFMSDEGSARLRSLASRQPIAQRSPGRTDALRSGFPKARPLAVGGVACSILAAGRSGKWRHAPAGRGRPKKWRQAPPGLIRQATCRHCNRAHATGCARV